MPAKVRATKAAVTLRAALTCRFFVLPGAWVCGFVRLGLTPGFVAGAATDRVAGFAAGLAAGFAAGLAAGFAGLSRSSVKLVAAPPRSADSFRIPARILAAWSSAAASVAAA